MQFIHREIPTLHKLWCRYTRNVPAGSGNLGVVQELITGRDGLTQAAHVGTTRGVTTMPIVKLYPLEVTSDNEH
ncbi:hypothetical protein DPMN_116344 [Dreissena polymorpha]|uniref:Uncharacterized protein n=1 Tax=Dreissena polymorpha TaxID=45954 RepID=A0A9D4KMW9_DREPO|nr:hypothetical protein DPMN_116344 [Dreissena polymorpha]